MTEPKSTPLSPPNSHVNPHITDVDPSDALSAYLRKMYAIGIGVCMDIYPKNDDLMSRCAGAFFNMAQAGKKWKIK
jgi:hypothetical protein